MAERDVRTDATTAHRLAVVATAAGVAVAVLWLSAPLAGPSLLWDGTAYLSLARWLAGEATPYLGHLGHYSVGYPLVLVPVVWLTSSLDGLFDGARVVNALAVASTVPALVVLARRLTALDRWASLAFAGAAALTPAIAVQAGFEWSESVFVATVTWSAVTAARWASAKTDGRAAAFGAVSAAAYVVHPRGLAVVLATVLVLIVAGRRGIVGLIALLLALGAGELLNRTAIEELWNPAVASQSAALVDTVTMPSRWDDAAVRGVGQLWYALVATAGLAVVGFGALAARARQWRAEVSWLLLAVVTTAGVSVAKLATQTRPDHLVYGRYLDPWLPVLAIVGVGTLVAMSWRARVACASGAVAAIGVLTAVLHASHDGDAFDGVFLPLNALSAVALDWSGNGVIDVTAISVAAAVLTLAVLLSAATAPRVAGVAFAVVALAGSVAVLDRHVRPFSDEANAAFVLGGVLDRVDRDAPVAYDMRVFDARGTNRYALADRDRTFTFYDSARAERPAHDLIVAGKDVARPPVRGARPIFPEPNHEQTLWVAPGGLQDRLAARGFVIALPGADPGAAFGNGAAELVGVDGDGVRVRVHKDAGGAPWLAPGSLPASGGAVTVAVTVDGRTWRHPLPRTLLPGDAVTVVVPVDVGTGEHVVRVLLETDLPATMPADMASLRFR